MRLRHPLLCALVMLLAGCSLPDPQVHVVAENAAGQAVQAHVTARFDRKDGGVTQVLEWSGTLPQGSFEVGTFQRPCQDGRVGVVTYNATVGGHSVERAQDWPAGGCFQQHIVLRVTGNATAEWDFA